MRLTLSACPPFLSLSSDSTGTSQVFNQIDTRMCVNVCVCDFLHVFTLFIKAKLWIFRQVLANTTLGIFYPIDLLVMSLLPDLSTCSHF